MKKTLVALAAVASMGAFAQSSVTISGQLDAGLYVTKTSGGATAANNPASLTTLGSGNFGASRLRFVGVEDMGGGNKANFWLEMQPNMVNGSISGNGLFNRGAWLGLSGDSWGAVRMGRQGTVSIGAVCTIDLHGCYSGFSGGGILFTGSDAAPGNMTKQWFAANPTRGGAGQAPSTGAGNTAALIATAANSFVTGGNNNATADATRVVNAVTYLSPNMSGFTAQVQYAFASIRGASGDGATTGLQLAYSAGPIGAVFAYQTAGTTAAVNASGKLTTLGGTYDFGVAKVGLGYQSETAGGPAALFTGARSWALTAMAPMGALAPYVKLGAHKYTSGGGVSDSQVFNIGTTYSLSKRTAIYADYAVDNKTPTLMNALFGTTNAAKPTTMAIGLQHTF